MSVLIGSTLSGSAWADESLAWGSITALAPIDRTVAQTLVDESLSSFANEQAAAIIREQSGAAVAPLDDRGTILFVRTPSFGNCGDYYVTVFGPTNSGNVRPRLMSQCASVLSLHPVSGLALPDIVIAVSDLVDEVWEWNDTTWQKARTVENLKPQAMEAPSADRHATLGTYAGTYDVIGVLNTAKIGDRLRERLGGDYVTLLRNLSTRGPWNIRDECLEVSGNAPHEGGINMALLAISLKTGETHAAILTNGRLVLFSPASNVSALPASVRAFLSTKKGASLEQSSDFTWLR